MKALLIGNKEIKKATTLKDYASKHRLSLAVMEKIVAGTAPPIGDNPRFAVDIRFGYRAVYTIEEHPLKDGTGTQWFHHISCSVHGAKNGPHPLAVQEIMKLFGMDMPLESCLVYMEGEGSPSPAINVIGVFNDPLQEPSNDAT